MPTSRNRSVVITPGGLRALIATPMSKIEHGVLWTIAGYLPGTGSPLSQSELAEQLGASTAHVNKVVKRLTSAGFLLRGERTGLSFHFRLNPAFLYILEE